MCPCAADGIRLQRHIIYDLVAGEPHLLWPGTCLLHRVSSDGAYRARTWRSDWPAGYACANDRRILRILSRTWLDARLLRGDIPRAPGIPASGLSDAQNWRRS